MFLCIIISPCQSTTIIITRHHTTSPHCCMMSHNKYLISLQLLIGCLQGNCRSGQLELVDSTGVLPVALPVVLNTTDGDLATTVSMTPASTPPLSLPPLSLPHLIGSHIAIERYKVVYERIERSSCVSVNVMYLCIDGLNDLTVLVPYVRGPSLQCHLHITPADIPSTSCYIRITAKGGVRFDQADGPVQFEAHVVLHEDLSALRDLDVTSNSSVSLRTAVLKFTGPLVHWHCSLHHKGLYSLTSSVSGCLPSPQMLAQNPCIVVCECMAFNLLDLCPSSAPPFILDIVDILSHVLIPSPYDATHYASESDTTRRFL